MSRSKPSHSASIAAAPAPPHPTPTSPVDTRRNPDGTVGPPLVPVSTSPPFARSDPRPSVSPASFPRRWLSVSSPSALAAESNCPTTSDSRSCTGSSSGSFQNPQSTAHRPLPLLDSLFHTAVMRARSTGTRRTGLVAGSDAGAAAPARLRPDRAGCRSRNMSAPPRIGAERNSAIRLLCSARTPSTKKLPRPTASRITRVWLPGRREADDRVAQREPRRGRQRRDERGPGRTRRHRAPPTPRRIRR